MTDEQTNAIVEATRESGNQTAGILGEKLGEIAQNLPAESTLYAAAALQGLLTRLGKLREVLAATAQECEFMAYACAGDPLNQDSLKWFASTAGKLRQALDLIDGVEGNK